MTSEWGVSRDVRGGVSRDVMSPIHTQVWVCVKRCEHTGEVRSECATPERRTLCRGVCSTFLPVSAVQVHETVADG